MNPQQLLNDANEAIEQGTQMRLIFGKGRRRPAGFPRGEFCGETERGNVYSIEPQKVIAWLENNGLIAI